jgi:serine/threonine protein phosphatase 1
MATVAIGDVHGNLNALEDLLAKVLPTLTRRDAVVFLGDYIDKGPDVPGCIDRIIRLREQAPCPVETLMGNHEHSMLRAWKDPTSHSWIWIGGFETIQAYSADAAADLQTEMEAAGPRLITEKLPLPYHLFFEQMPPSHQALFKSLKPYHETDDVLCVHAGMDPHGGPVQLQDVGGLVWGTDGFPDEYRGQRPVVYGHWENPVEDETGWPWPRIQWNRTYGIDTISRGILTALRLPDGEIIQSKKYIVDASRQV